MARLERCEGGVAATLDVVALADAARAGDGEAWEILYRRAYPKLLAYARRRLDADAARDAVAETMARAVARIDKFSWTGGGFDAWLFGILRHVVLDVQRARARRREAGPAVVDHADDGSDPLHHLLRSEEALALRAAFARLGAEDRELLELRVVARLSSDEVAAVLGKRAGAVRMAQARALGRLRALLEAGWR
jgi:RNA polymerase sigma-70 factor (ECF subfamily)